ncbi:MAG: GspH/FimT family pseudopilin [Pseudomonadota bacterium]
MRRYQSGLTLLELLITVALAAVLLGVGIPSFQRAFEAARTGQWTRDISSFVGLARTEALQRGQTVLIEPTGADWSTEWGLGPDLDGDGALDANEIIHRMAGVAATDFTMVDRNGTDLLQLEFDSRGWPPLRLATPISIGFQPDGCSAPDEHRRAMTIRPNGGMGPSEKQECI